MAKLGDLIVRVGADTRDLNRSLGRVQRNMRSMTGNMQKLGRSITQSVTLPLAGMAALSVQTFRDQAKAVAQVEQGLKSTGNAAGRTLGDLTKMASELQKTTLFGDEDILQNATAQLLTFTNIAGEQFDRTQKAALDLATRLGGDLKSASIQLGKALNDPIANLSALSRSGIQFSKEQKEVIKSLAETGELAKAQGIILDELEKQYGGSAEAAAEADGGITQLGNAIGDLGEQIGKVVTQMIAPMIKKVRTLVEGFANLDDNTKRFVVRLGGIIAAFGPILFFLPQIITQVKLLSVALASNPIIAAAGVITSIGFALQGMKGDADQARTSVDDLRDSFAELDDASRKQKRAEVAATIEQIFRYKELVQQFESLGDQYEGQAFAISKTIRAQNDFKESLSESDKAILKNVGALIKTKGTIADMTDPIERANNKILDLQNELAALTRQQVEVNEELDEGNTTVRHYAGGLEEAAHAITDFSIRTQTARMSMGEFFSMLENVQVQAEATKQNFIDMGDVIRMALTGIAGAFDGTGNFIMKGLRVLGGLMTNIGNQLIALATSMKAFRKFIITNPGLAIAAGVGFVIAGQALSNMAQRNLEVPALANGGVAYGPTMAMIGDNRNAAIDPEVVAPLSKLRDMMGGNQVEVFGRIQGNDIFLSNARTGTSRNRYA
jgi:predicted  nucleic acid-binding Zn-ribbon protein